MNEHKALPKKVVRKKGEKPCCKTCGKPIRRKGLGELFFVAGGIIAGMCIRILTRTVVLTKISMQDYYDRHMDFYLIAFNAIWIAVMMRIGPRFQKWKHIGENVAGGEQDGGRS